MRRWREELTVFGWTMVCLMAVCPALAWVIAFGAVGALFPELSERWLRAVYWLALGVLGFSAGYWFPQLAGWLEARVRSLVGAGRAGRSSRHERPDR